MPPARRTEGYFALLALCLVTFVSNANVNANASTSARQYERGHHALQIFDAAGMEATPDWVIAWIAFATLCFAAGLFFVRGHRIARWVVGGYITGFAALVASSIFDSDVFRLAGFNALVHVIFWTPSLYHLMSERPFAAAPPTAFSIWSGVISGVMLFSYVFDVPYALTFLRHVFFEL